MEHTDYNQITPKKSNTIFDFKKIFHFFKQFRSIPFFVIILFFVVIAFFGIQRSIARPSEINVLSQTDERVSINSPVLEKKLNKSFAFPLQDQTGREVSKFTYTVEGIEVRDQIIVKGQKATAVKGRRFLVINVKLTNNYDKTISINAKDYLRVIINGSSEKIAPDMHSDPVEVQPISTKTTRLGLTIDDVDKNITLQIGEISGKKETIPVLLK